MRSNKFEGKGQKDAKDIAAKSTIIGRSEQCLDCAGTRNLSVQFNWWSLLRFESPARKRPA